MLQGMAEAAAAQRRFTAMMQRKVRSPSARLELALRLERVADESLGREVFYGFTRHFLICALDCLRYYDVEIATLCTAELAPTIVETSTRLSRKLAATYT